MEKRRYGLEWFGSTRETATFDTLDEMKAFLIGLEDVPAGQPQFGFLLDCRGRGKSYNVTKHGRVVLIAPVGEFKSI